MGDPITAAMLLHIPFRPKRLFLALVLMLLTLGLATPAWAAEHQGVVTFNGRPVPGATVTALQNGAGRSTTTDGQGRYEFRELAGGICTLKVEMFGFTPIERQIEILPLAPPLEWTLQILSLDEIRAAYKPATAPPVVSSSAADPTTSDTAPAPPPGDPLAEEAAEGYLINGSVNNTASAEFGQSAAFGNRRVPTRGLYNGGIGFTLDNSALDARPYSLTGQILPKPAYNRFTGLLTLGGPLRIPGFLENGPFFFFGYQWMRNNNATTSTARMPGVGQRNGIVDTTVLDPTTGMPFAGNLIPKERFSPQAQALLNLYPLPNVESVDGYNYQLPLVSPTHQDSLQSRLNKYLGTRDQLNGSFAFQSTRTDSPSIFSFLDTVETLGVNSNVNWWHRLGTRLFMNLGFQFSRYSTTVHPYFANRINVSGDAGIHGNNQDPENWGPPALTFSSGIAGLDDAQSARNRNQTAGISYSMQWSIGSHNLTFGGDFRKQQFNYLSQINPRGSFAFTGAASGNDFADFLLGVPATSSIAYGNADKYLRQNVYDAYFTDDWRINAALSINAGIRWEYGAPVTERYDRLVNLDIAPGFTSIAQVLAGTPDGDVTGETYPGSLVRPDRNGFAPRVGIAWRPFPASPTVIRAGYGIYYDTSVYQSLAIALAQQPPLSTVARVQNSPENPLSLENGFAAALEGIGNTLAVDPDFRVGYAQNWQASIQRDLPWSLQLTGTYSGIKGTRAMQEFLPNTWPSGAENPCPACPAGYSYLSSNGNSIRHAAQVQLRRRLRSGFTATLDYTFSKSIDNAAYLGGPGASGAGGGNPQNPMGSGFASGPAAASGGGANRSIAQNWLDLAAERARSGFDQRHVLNLNLQYTTGMGLGGGTLMTGWRGTLLKEWTFSTQLSAASGTPQTPIYLAPVSGTGVTGTLRPDYTGASLYTGTPGAYLNAAAYAAPQAGRWGNAGRNTIEGPDRFLLNAAISRAFRLTDKLNLDVRIDAANILNRVNFTSWNTVVNSPQFGLAAAANDMRTLHTTVRLRF